MLMAALAYMFLGAVAVLLRLRNHGGRHAAHRKPMLDVI